MTNHHTHAHLANNYTISIFVNYTPPLEMYAALGLGLAKIHYFSIL